MWISYRPALVLVAALATFKVSCAKKDDDRVCVFFWGCVNISHREELHPKVLQEWWMWNITDILPPLEEIDDCDCPRMYLPVCGTDNQSYTNLCYLNCLHINNTKGPRLYYMGMCYQFLDPFAY